MTTGSVVWVFTGAGARFPAGVFSCQETAEAWIQKHALTGVLTAYPLDVGAYDWATGNGLFVPKRQEHFLSAFVGSFTSAQMEHVHFEDGHRVS